MCSDARLIGVDAESLERLVEMVVGCNGFQITSDHFVSFSLFIHSAPTPTTLIPHPKHPHPHRMLTQQRQEASWCAACHRTRACACMPVHLLLYALHMHHNP